MTKSERVGGKITSSKRKSDPITREQEEPANTPAEDGRMRTALRTNVKGLIMCPGSPSPPLVHKYALIDLS